MIARERLIVALDHPTVESALGQVDALGDVVTRYKVGLELYLASGRAVVDELHARKKRVFLDLKLHDIPETVERATEVVARYGVDLMTVHASGGVEMMRRAVRAAGATRVLAVTVLTSLDAADLHADLSSAVSPQALVLARAKLATEAGCAGVVASPLETAAIRAAHAGLMIVTPGVRRAAAAGSARKADDQKRVATPGAARQAGADAIVVGRPIRDAGDAAHMRAEAEAILTELGAG